MAEEGTSGSAHTMGTRKGEEVKEADGNEAGRIGSAECAAKLAPLMRVRLVWLPLGKEPDMLTPNELHTLLGF